MIGIAELIKNRPVESAEVISARKEILDKFIKVINDGRRMAGYKPYPASFVVIKMYKAGYKSVSQLWMFWGSCSDAQNFSSYWHWKLKKENYEKQ